MSSAVIYSTKPNRVACCRTSEKWNGHLVDAPLDGVVEAILIRRVSLHFQDFGGDGRRQEDHGVGLLETHQPINRGEGQPVPCKENNQRWQTDRKPREEINVARRQLPASVAGNSPSPTSRSLVSSCSMMEVMSLATRCRVLEVGSDCRSMANTQSGAQGSPGETGNGGEGFVSVNQRPKHKTHYSGPVEEQPLWIIFHLKHFEPTNSFK